MAKNKKAKKPKKANNHPKKSPKTHSTKPKDSRTTEEAQDDRFAERWNAKYEELKAYAMATGNCLVPKEYKENPSLGNWVSEQRKKYNRNKLSKDCHQKLQRLGFVWKVGPEKAASAPEFTSHSEQWKKRYQELKVYVAAHGNCLVPYRYPDNPSLGRWVNTQRTLHNQNQLDMDRQQKLQQLGFVWKVGHGNGKKKKPGQAKKKRPAENTEESTAQKKAKATRKGNTVRVPNILTDPNEPSLPSAYPVVPSPSLLAQPAAATATGPPPIGSLHHHPNQGSSAAMVQLLQQQMALQQYMQLPYPLSRPYGMPPDPPSGILPHFPEHLLNHCYDPSGSRPGPPPTTHHH